MPTELKLTPTVLIGLGGTGKDVILRIRRQFYERSGHTNRYPIIASLVLDTNNKDLDRIAGEDVPPYIRRQIALNANDDVPSFIFCELTDNEFRDYFNGGYQTYPHVFRWLPQQMDQYGVAAVRDGAGQNRLFGRLMWFHHYPHIRAVLKSHIQRVIAHAVQPALLHSWLPDGAHVETGTVEVAIIYSLAGGTGCGMFMDTGMLVRDVLKEFPSVSPHITHYMVLPDALTSSRGVLHETQQRKKVEENAFAALREMEYFALRRENLFDLSIPPRPRGIVGAGDRPPLFEVTWDKGQPPTPITDAPWNTCYLIGASNDPLRGDPLAHHDIYQMIAEHLFLDFDPSDFGEKKRTSRSNLVQQALETMRSPVQDERGVELYARYVSRRFSTLGLAQLQFDRDRMRRAAAHRLARLLIERWWLRSNGLLPTDVAQRAEEDLGPDLRGDKDIDEVITRSGREAEGVEIPRLGMHSIARRLTRTGPGENWVSRVNEEYKQKRALIQDEGFDPLTTDPLSGWVSEHQGRLTAPAVGAPLTGDRGIALRTFEENQRRLLPDVDGRIADLFAYRIETFGLPDTLALFGAYDNLNKRRVAAADQVRARGGEGGGAWKTRVEEARKLPLYSRQVTRLEYLRGVLAAWRQITSAYQHGMSDQLAGCYRLVDRRVGANQAEGSYQVSLRGFIANLEDVRRFLRERFVELSANEAGRRDTAGKPGEAVSKTGRVTALLEQQTEDEYDRQIVRALGWPALDPTQSGMEPRWRDLERKVLAELARSPDRRLQNIGSTAALVLGFQPVDRRDSPAPREIEALALELARACEPLLDRFADDITALREYIRDANPDRLLSNLRIYSAPYLRKDQGVNIAREADIPPIQLLGLAGYDGPDGKRFIDALRQSGERDQLPLASLQSLDMKDDAIVLYREKAGIPLAYYADLDQLGKQYDASVRKLELHLDHSYLNGRLPEIRKIDQKKQTTLANCLKLALLGIMTGRVKADGAKTGDRREPDSVTFSVLYRGITHTLGQQLDAVVSKLAEDGHADIRNDLSGQVAKWLTDQAGKENGLGIAVLWAALKTFHEEIRWRVDNLPRHSGPGGRPVEHPLLGYVGNHVIPFVREKLEGIPNGLEWIHPLLDWERVRDDVDAPPSSREQARQLWDQYVAPGFARINDHDLPLPVLRLPDPRFATTVGGV